jgi:hypothetical protein
MNDPGTKIDPVNGSKFERLITDKTGYVSLEDFYESVSARDWIFAARDKGEILKLLKEHYSAELKQILDRANRLTQNQFDIFCGGPTYLGAKIDWHLDFKSGRIWKKDFYLNVPLMFWGDYSDAKVPWELSRFYYLLDLAIAHNVSGSHKYLNKFISLIEDWIYENPCAYGINWASPMEAAIRAVNLLAAFELFDGNLFSINFKSKFFRVLYQHGDFIMSNLAVYGPGINNNQYIFDLVGLLVLGRLFHRLPAGKVWHQFARTKLEEDIFAQISPDGTCFESSLNYQLVILELYLFVFNFERRFAAEFTDEFKARLMQGCAAIYNLSKPDQTIPNFGDSGSDRLFKLVERDERVIFCLMDLAAVILGLKNYHAPKIRPEPELLMWTGCEGYKAYFEKVICPRKSKGSYYFSDSGLAVMRGAKSYLGFFANSASRLGLGGHKHNDILSIEFSYGRDNFLVDSGTYVYTGDPSGRNYFRKTGSHSTLEVDGQEINRFLPKILFSIRRDAEVEEVQWDSENGYDFISAEHSGYSRLENPVIVKRSLHFDKQHEIYLFKDDFLGSGKHLLSGNLILDYNVKAGMAGNCVILQAASGQMAVIVFADQDWYLEKIPHYISKSYGSKLESWKIRYHKIDKAPQTCLWGLFGIDSVARIETKIADFHDILKSLNWKSGTREKLILRKEAEEIKSLEDIQRLFIPGLRQLEKEKV